MNRALLITYEPALFLIAALGWAGWELWSLRKKKADASRPSDAAAPHDPPPGSA